MIKSKEVKEKLNYTKYHEHGKLLYDYITQQENLTELVKRLLKLNAKGVTDAEETNEFRQLLKEMKEMVAQ